MRVYYLVDTETGQLPLGSDYIFVKPDKKTDRITPAILRWKIRVEQFKSRTYKIHVAKTLDDIPDIFYER